METDQERQEKYRRYALDAGWRIISVTYRRAHGVEIEFPDAYETNEQDIEGALNCIMIGSHSGRIGA